MAVNTQDYVDAEGPGQYSRVEAADNVESKSKDRSTPDCRRTSDHTVRSHSDQKDMEKDDPKLGRPETPSTTPKHSRRKIALVMTALGAGHAKFYNEPELLTYFQASRIPSRFGRGQCFLSLRSRCHSSTFRL